LIIDADSAGLLPFNLATLSMDEPAGTITASEMLRRITIDRPSAAAGSSLRTMATSAV
jgi:hypothetical protein